MTASATASAPSATGPSNAGHVVAIGNAPTASPGAAPTSGIECRGLTKTYKSGEIESLVLREMDLRIEPGEFTVVLGPSGCGKTTFLNLLGALDRPDGGELWVAGTEIGRLSDKERVAYRARDVGFIFQFYNLLPTLSAQENVELGLEPLGLAQAERRERAFEMLKKVSLEKKSHNFPSQLSGGEQQRVAVARALARKPHILLGDEPTGNLDEDTGNRVFGLMRDLQRELGCMAVIVTHNNTLAKDADRVVRMREGRVQP
jgi:ABC-type lipoprotein export system ATPase subunit